jgi:hypothetical protein
MFTVCCLIESQIQPEGVVVRPWNQAGQKLSCGSVRTTRIGLLLLSAKTSLKQ